MFNLGQAQGYVMLVLTLAALALEVFAFAHALRTRPDAFVAAGVYLADVRPAVETVQGRGTGSHQGPYGPW